MSTEVVSRQDARGRGITYYFTGKPCKRGHVAPRFVYNSVCKDCHALHNAKYVDKNAEKVDQYRKAYAEKNKGRIGEYRRDYYSKIPQVKLTDRRERSKEWYWANRAEVLEKDKERYWVNPEKHRLRARRYQIENPGQVAANTAKRRAVVKRATVPWANLDAIRKFYYEAASLTKAGTVYHVDHIVPLQHDLVCGLHVEYNLQLLTGVENQSKRNKFDPDRYVHETP